MSFQPEEFFNGDHYLQHVRKVKREEEFTGTYCNVLHMCVVCHIAAHA